MNILIKKPNTHIFTKLVTRMSSISSTDEVLIKKVNNVGCITLNRPKQLNALTLTMVTKLLIFTRAVRRSIDLYLKSIKF
jgi:hypothetical protein